jgi:hypothetical protein
VKIGVGKVVAGGQDRKKSDCEGRHSVEFALLFEPLQDLLGAFFLNRGGFGGLVGATFGRRSDGVRFLVRFLSS